jgi:hypothetical protein
MNKTRINPKRATAMHEAGHAVIHVFFELRGINSVTINEDGDTCGCLSHQPPLYYANEGRKVLKQVARQMIVCLYAGIIAERIYDPEAPDFHAEHDEVEARALPRDYELRIPGCSFVGDDAYDRFLERQRGEARKLVIRFERVIVALAEELLKCGSMSGDAVELFVNQKLGRTSAVCDHSN